MKQHLTGLIAAPHTPFDLGGEVDLNGIDQQAEFMESRGVSGVFICGTTAEGSLLSLLERKQIAERWMQAAGDRLRVIIHVGHVSLVDACELAEHARGLSPFAVAALPPYFFRPATVDALVASCAEIANCAGALPFYYYHIPSMSNVFLPMPEFLLAGAKRIPTLQGIKFTHNDLLEYRQCVSLESGRFDIPFGRDEILLAGLALGAKAAVGSTYNYASPHFLKMIRAFQTGDLETAQSLSDDLSPLISLLRECGEIAAAKGIMTELGVPLGAPRLPLIPLTPEQAARVEKFVATWAGFKKDAISAKATTAL